MKLIGNKIRLFFLFSGIILLFSCEKEGDSFNVSKETTFAIVEITGDPIIVIPVGQAYTDEGATALEGTNPVELTTVGSVDVNTPGVYTITYSAVNSNGYPTVVKRLVGVCTPAALNADLSGNYQRDAGRQGISTWTRIEPGLYQTTDIGGALLPDDWVYVFNTDENIVVVPSQPLGGGNGSSVEILNENEEPEIPFIPGEVGQIAYSWIIFNPGYGAALRNFIRVE